MRWHLAPFPGIPTELTCVWPGNALGAIWADPPSLVGDLINVYWTWIGSWTQRAAWWQGHQSWTKETIQTSKDKSKQRSAHSWSWGRKTRRIMHLPRLPRWGWKNNLSIQTAPRPRARPSCPHRGCWGVASGGEKSTGHRSQVQNVLPGGERPVVSRATEKSRTKQPENGPLD